MVEIPKRGGWGVRRLEKFPNNPVIFFLMLTLFHCEQTYLSGPPWPSFGSFGIICRIKRSSPTQVDKLLTFCFFTLNHAFLTQNIPQQTTQEEVKKKKMSFSHFVPTLNIVIIVWPFQSYVYCAASDTNNVLQRSFGHICSLLQALFSKQWYIL